MDITFTLWTQSLNSLKEKKGGHCKQVDKHCTQRMSLFFFVFLGGLKAPWSSMASFSHYPNETKCWDWIKIEKEDWKQSFQALRSAARVNHLVVMILEFGMILCDVAEAATAGTWRLLLCAYQAIKSAKCQGNFFTVFHMQRGKEEGEKKPHAAFKAGKEANRSTILRRGVPRLRR